MRIHRLKSDLAFGRQPDSGFLNTEIDPEDRNGLLLTVERFRLQQLIGNTSGSSADFMAAYDFERRLEEEKPLLAFSDLLNQSSAIMINDTALPYRSMIRTCLLISCKLSTAA